MRDTVAIIGSHPRTRKDFDFGRMDCDIWVMNESLSNGTMPRADATFQMHDPVIWKNPNNRNDSGYSRWIVREDIPPVYMQEDYPEVPKAIQYPLDGVLGMTANFNKNRFITSSPAYAIALAIYLGYKRIEIYGVEMETNTEYTYQRAGVAYWIGVAVGRGIEVWTNSGIFDEPLYGYEGTISIKEGEYQQRIAELKAKLPELDMQYKANRQVVSQAMEQFVQDGNKDALIEKIRRLTASAIAYGQCDGAAKENEYYMAKVVAMRDQVGGQIIVRQEYEQKAAALAIKISEETVNIVAIQKKMDVDLELVVQTKNKDRKRVRMKNFAKNLNELLISCTRIGVYQGAMSENQQYMEKLDGYIRASGGKKSEAVMLEMSNGLTFTTKGNDNHG